MILDSGSTALAVANCLKGRGLGLTVVTPSVLAALALVDEPDTTVVLTGGELRAGELSLIGPSAEDTLANYNCDTYVMGVAGIDGDRGISDYHQAESRVTRAASKRADRVIVAADKSIVRNDLPAGWGLLVPHGTSLRAAVKPTRRTALAMPLPIVVSIARAVQRTEVSMAACGVTA